MRRALVGSLVFHLALTVAVFQWIAFNQVKYVPRDVYSIKLVAAGAAQAARPAAAASVEAPPKPEPGPVEPEKEEDDRMPPPPDDTKKKPKPAEKKGAKTIPSTDVRKTDARPDSNLVGGGGSGAALSGPASGGVSFDSGDFPYASYISRMRQKIAVAWQVPAGGAGTPRSAVVYFRAHRDGRVSDVRVEQSSGVPLFDHSCQRAVMEAAPLPPLPREYRDEYVGIHFSFVYEPTQQ